ncbi:diguanylate cyclase [Deinococcus geothermalis DSM 11300]|uniref:Diguanylate cyclase n=2 Tax=Deinococcus geothermalis TaxID=68909 RepID=Q1IXJ5_DEIGD|nr:diguanylate cyclase [Deinococcus geothermalis DSM 11300]
MLLCGRMRDPLLPFPDALPPADAWRGRSVFRRGPDRRETYQLVLPLALLGTLLPLALSQPTPAGVLLAAPLLLAGVLGLVLGLSLMQRCPVWVLDLLLLVGGWAFVGGELALGLFLPDTAEARLAAANVAPWFLVLLLAHGWLLGERRSQALSLAALGGTLALTAAYALDPATAGGPGGRTPLNALSQLVLAGAVMLLGQQAAMRRLRHQLRRISLELPDQECDPLTGLPGRRMLERVLRDRLPRQASGLTVAVLALDGLAEVEAERGVAFVEALRAHVARTLIAATRDEDVVGYLGEGTFAVLMRMPDGRFARAVCERLRLRVASRPLQGILPTVSVGVAIWKGEERARALLGAAQQAMTQAQQDGGNRVYLSPVPDGLSSAPAA